MSPKRRKSEPGCQHEGKETAESWHCTVGYRQKRRKRVKTRVCRTGKGRKGEKSKGTFKAYSQRKNRKRKWVSARTRARRVWFRASARLGQLRRRDSRRCRAVRAVQTGQGRARMLGIGRRRTLKRVSFWVFSSVTGAVTFPVFSVVLGSCGPRLPALGARKSRCGP